jgi:hypothetical protein
MSFDESASSDSLLLEVIRLEGKLLALQRANSLVIPNHKGSASPTAVSHEKLKLSHNISSTSTDCPDESTEGVGSPYGNEEEDDDEVTEDDEKSSSEDN